MCTKHFKAPHSPESSIIMRYKNGNPLEMFLCSTNFENTARM